MDENTEQKTLRDYLDAFGRHKARSALIVAGVFLLGLILAFLLPPVYRSSATILIEEQEIPPELVRSTITTYATQRLEMISQRVMTRANLQKIIDKFDLYANSRQRLTEEEIIEKMRDDIALDTISADIIDPRTGRPSTATIAFTLSYDGRNPELTQRVANEITSLYLEENLKNRTQKSAETSEFLQDETRQMGDYVTRLETQLAAFKEQHFNSLPEQRQVNMDLLDRTERDLLGTEIEIRGMEDRRFYLEGQLGQIKPDVPGMTETGERILNPADRLKMLRTEYLGLASRYSERHPDVLKARHELEALSRETGGSDNTAGLGEELQRLRTERAALAKTYSENHPSLSELDRRIGRVEREIGRTQADRTLFKAAQANPENPAYITLRAQRDSTVQDLQALKSKQRELKARLDGYQNRLAQAPAVERQYLALVRDYENATLRYRELKAKEMEARVAEELEKKRKGERFSIVEPPALPEKPIKPNRPVIAFLSLTLSFVGGFGYVMLRENLDTTVRGSRAVALLAGSPPLTLIPWLATEEDLEARSRRRMLLMLTALGLFALMLVMIHTLWIPLDVLWFRGLRKLDSLWG
jgi:succinoglycan biosynthesis transport protein ExoP